MMVHDEYRAVVISKLSNISWLLTTSLRCVTKVFIVICSGEKNTIVYVRNDLSYMVYANHMMQMFYL